MSGLVGSSRVGAGRDREADFAGQRLVYRTIGDSNVEGGGAATEHAAGLRPWLQKYLESYRGNIRAVGTKGYGDSFWGSATYGSFSYRMSWWEHDGLSGEKIGYELPIISATSGSATLTSSTAHGMAAGSVFRWSSPPAPFSATALYIVATAPTSTTFTLKSSDAGSGIQASESGAAFAGMTGMVALPPILAAQAPERETVITFPAVGTNDILALIAAGATPSAAAAETLTRARLLIRESLAAWNDSDQVFVFGGIPPVSPGTTSGVTWSDKNQAASEFRTLLAAEVASRGSRFSYRNIWDVSPADNIGDGFHFSSRGHMRAGMLLGEEIQAVTRDAISGRPFPRSTKRERAPKLALTGTTGRVTGPSTSIGSSTVMIALSYRPGTGNLPADSTNRFLFWLGASDYTTGIGISARNTYGVAGRAGIIIYLMSTIMQTSSSGYSADGGLNSYKILREGEWTDLVLLFNAASLRCVTWINGELLNNVAVSAPWNIAANTWKIGHISTGLPASEGYYQDLEIATGASLTVEQVAIYAKARYAERIRAPGTIDFRRFSEGTGTSAASPIPSQAAATLSGLSGWIAADSSVAPWEN